MTDAVPSNTEAAATGASGVAAGGEAAPAKDMHINIKVKAQDGTEIYFKIKRST